MYGLLRVCVALGLRSAAAGAIVLGSEAEFELAQLRTSGQPTLVNFFATAPTSRLCGASWK